jgi:hypothetical protein
LGVAASKNSSQFADEVDNGSDSEDCRASQQDHGRGDHGAGDHGQKTAENPERGDKLR